MFLFFILMVKSYATGVRLKKEVFLVFIDFCKSDMEVGLCWPSFLCSPCILSGTQCLEREMSQVFEMLD